MRIFLILLILSSFMVTSIQMEHPQSAALILGNTTPYIQEFPLPTPQAVPGPIAVAPNGTVWFAETNASSLAKFNPQTKSFTEFAFKNSPTFILSSYATKSINSIATDSEGNVWFTLSAANAFGYFNTTDQAFTYYNLTQLTHRTYSNFPFGITLDSNGIAWIAETGASRIGKFDISNGSFQEYALPQPNASPLEIYVDSNHELWITSYWYTNGNNPQSGSTLTRFDPASQEIIRQYNLSVAGILTPVGVAVDQSNHAWIGDHAGSWLGEVNALTGEVKLHRTSLPPLNPHPQNLTDRVFDASITLVNDVVLGNDGTPWFIEHIGARVGHYIPSNETIVEYNIPTQTPITLWMAADLTGGLWFTEEFGNKLGFLDTRHAAPPFEATPSSINALVVPGASTTFTVNVTNLSPNPINITAGVENTPSFFGPLTNIVLPAGASRQVAIQMSSSSYLLSGNYTSGILATLAPIIKVTDGNVNYPIAILADVTNSPFNAAVLLDAAAGSIVIIALATGTMLLYNRKKNNASETQTSGISDTK
jgi:streptogramin lyase